MVRAVVNSSMTSLFWVLEVSFAIFLLFVEGFAHLLWATFPIRFITRFIFGGNSSKDEKTLDMSFVELVQHYGYKAEEHYVQTKDGYVLCIHRVAPKDPSNVKGVVFFQHGFMQNSESFIVRGPEKSLPFKLVDLGYDVWLGNNRGNKYSYKHLQYSPKDDGFWDFCIDDFALSDIPAMISYILVHSGFKSITYVGFSQGTAQAFAAFSVNPQLTEKISLFVALAPATRVKQLNNRMVAALTTSRPDLVFLLFGKKSLLPEALFWRRVLSTNLHVMLIDYCMKFLFGWTCLEIDSSEKPILYSHIYSYSSVKCLVHWFQITRMKRFQMFDGNISPMNRYDNFDASCSSYPSYLLPSYQLSKIRCPIAIFYGGKDSIPETEHLLSEINSECSNNNLQSSNLSNSRIFIHKEDNYEHLDFIWGKSAPERIFTKVIDLIQQQS